MPTTKQHSFARGEITPALYARDDLEQFYVAARTLRNFYVGRTGGAYSRPGTTFAGESKADTATPPQLIPFVFNAQQSYQLEFGDLYLRFIKNGAYVLETPVAITDITQASPAVVTANAHGYSNGDYVVIEGVEGMIEINGHSQFRVQNVTANTFELRIVSSQPAILNFSTVGYSAYTSGGTVARIYQIATPYVLADVQRLHHVQDADVMKLTRQGYAPRQLSRLGETNWTLTTIAFEPSIGRPNGGQIILSDPTGATSHMYRVTALRSGNREESLPGREATRNLAAAPAITQANPAVVTTAANHGYLDGDEVFIEGVQGMTQVNGRTFTINVLSNTTFELLGENSTGYGAHTAGGTVARTYIRINNNNNTALSPTNVVGIAWSTVAGAIVYRIYKLFQGLWAYLGETAGLSFPDIGLTPNVSLTHPENRDPFVGSNNWPATVTQYDQRTIYANTPAGPELMEVSRAAAPNNFITRFPLQDDDAFQIPLRGKHVNAIRHLVDIGVLAALTTGAEWVLKGDEAGTLRPGSPNAKQQSFHGCSVLQPIVIGREALFVAGRAIDFGSVVRSMRYRYENDGWDADELSIWAEHLLEGHTIVSWAHQQRPHSIVWCVRDDGVLISMTYYPQERLLAWHQHDTGGRFERVSTNPEGDEDAVYFVVLREFAGPGERPPALGIDRAYYVERLATRTILELEDFIGMDCVKSYDGWNTDELLTFQITGGTTWEPGELLEIEEGVDGPPFEITAADIGNEVWFRGADGTIVRFSIASVTGGIFGYVDATVPPGMRATLMFDVARAVDQIRGLWHLEGRDVSILGDGEVVASPNNEGKGVITIDEGMAQLPECHALVHVGLPFICDLQTLRPPGRSRSKKIPKVVTLTLEKSLGGYAGERLPADDAADPLEGLTEIKLRGDEDEYGPASLKTGPADVKIKGRHAEGGVVIRHIDPLPLTVLALEVDVEGAGRKS